MEKITRNIKEKTATAIIFNRDTRDVREQVFNVYHTLTEKQAVKSIEKQIATNETVCAIELSDAVNVTTYQMDVETFKMYATVVDGD